MDAPTALSGAALLACVGGDLQMSYMLPQTHGFSLGEGLFSCRAFAVCATLTSLNGQGLWVYP